MAEPTDKSWIVKLLESMFNMITKDVKGFVILGLTLFCWYQMRANANLNERMIGLQDTVYTRVIKQINPSLMQIKNTVNEAKAGVDTMREDLQPITRKIDNK